MTSQAQGDDDVRKFDPNAYGPGVTQLLAADVLPELGPGTARSEYEALLAGMDDDRLFPGRPVRDRSMADCCRAGLWLLHDFLDQSHGISQSVPTPSGSYWHGIMHRREPDYSNAKYWFRQVGPHPVFKTLAASARQLAEEAGDGCSEDARFLAEQPKWDPFAFVDLCQRIADGRSSAGPLARQVAMREWQVLFDYCWKRAVGADEDAGA